MNEEQTPQTEAVIEKTASAMTLALKRGTDAGARAAAELLPRVGTLMTRALYGTCYYTAFGTTFATMTLARLVPKGGIVDKGLHDGAEAARVAFREQRAPELPKAIEEAVETAQPA